MGRDQREQPALRKEGVGPALMITAVSPSRATTPTAQEAAQAQREVMEPGAHGKIVLVP